MTIEVQCTSCHTRYRIDEQVLPKDTPTFKCSRCGHVFTLEPRGAKRVEVNAEAPKAPERTAERTPPPESFAAELRSSRAGAVKRFSADTGAEIEPSTSELAIKRPEPPRPQQPIRNVTPPRPAAPPPVTPRVAPVAPPPPAPAAAAPKAPQARPPAPSTPREADDDLMSRPFHRDYAEDVVEPENLAFDFNRDADEPDALEHEDAGDAHDQFAGESPQWEVGDPDAADEREYAPPRQSRTQRSAARPTTPRFASAGSRAGKTRKEQEAEFEEDFPDEENAPVYNRRVTRSARFFIALFAMIIVGYGLMTLVIRNSPAVAAELLSHLPVVGERFELLVTPARMVALRDVHSGYIRTRDGHTALLITGSAENVGPIHSTQFKLPSTCAIRAGTVSLRVQSIAAVTICRPRWWLR